MITVQKAIDLLQAIPNKNALLTLHDGERDCLSLVHKISSIEEFESSIEPQFLIGDKNNLLYSQEQLHDYQDKVKFYKEKFGQILHETPIAVEVYIIN